MNTKEHVNRISEIVKAALEEDRAADDVTTAAAMRGEQGTAEIRAEAAGVLAGADILETVFQTAGPHLRVQVHMKDGERVEPGSLVATIEGEIADILRSERTALNFLMHLSGVATETARLVAALEGTGVTLLDTRKTLPMLRELQKAAVRAGGGVNHRRNLEETLLIKSNHVRAVGSLAEAVHRVRQRHPERFLEVEVRNLNELDEALGLAVDRVLLDNFGAEEAAEARRRSGGKIPLEASGGISGENIRKYALAGVDFISVGAVTHSAPALPFSLKVTEVKGRGPVSDGGS